MWYLYLHEKGQGRWPRVGPDLKIARQMAAQFNGQLETRAPAALHFEAISIVDLRNRWLDHQEHVLRSSIASITRYRAATEHLIWYFQGAKPIKFASFSHQSCGGFFRPSENDSGVAKRPLEIREATALRQGYPILP